MDCQLMSGEGDRVWDEYHWERLFRRQDARTSWYMPELLDLAGKASLVAAKIAAAVGDPGDDSDPAMSVAYLKRALAGINGVVRDLSILAERQAARSSPPGAGDPARGTTVTELRKTAFCVRGGIVSLMGQYRAVWQRRHAQ